MTAPFKLIRLPRRSRASSYNGYTATTPATRTILRGSTDTNTASRYKGKAKSDSTVVKGTGSKEHVLCIAIAILKGAIPAISAMIIASLVDQIVDIKATQYVVTLAYLQELRGVCYTAAAIATAILALSATAEWIMRHILQPRLLAHTATANYKALMRAVVTHSLLKVPSIPEASELVRSHYNKAISNMQLVESITSLLSVIGVLIYSWPTLIYNNLAQYVAGSTIGFFIIERLLLALSKDRNTHSSDTSNEQALSNIEALLVERGLNSMAAVEISMRNLGPWFRAKHTQLSKQAAAEPINTTLLATPIQQGSHDYTTGQLISVIAHIYIVRAALLTCLRAMYDSRAARPAIKHMNAIHSAAYSDSAINSDSRLHWSGWEQQQGPEPTTATRLSDVWLAYPGTKEYALQKISLTIPKGSLVAVIGPEACGKTTLSRVILGIIKPQVSLAISYKVDCEVFSTFHGTVSFELRSIYEWSSKVYRSWIEWLTQDSVRFELTAGESIGIGMLPLFNSRQSWEQAASITGADKSIAKLPE
eukprot:18518-Heterococcus_DN1.PRE.1